MPAMFRWPKFLRRNRPFDCPDVMRLSSDYVDDDLARPEDRRKIEAHLRWCPLCTRFIASLRSTVAVLRELPARTAPPGLKDQIRQQTGRPSDGK